MLVAHVVGDDVLVLVAVAGGHGVDHRRGGRVGAAADGGERAVGPAGGAGQGRGGALQEPGPDARAGIGAGREADADGRARLGGVRRRSRCRRVGAVSSAVSVNGALGRGQAGVVGRGDVLGAGRGRGAGPL